MYLIQIIYFLAQTANNGQPWYETGRIVLSIFLGIAAILEAYFIFRLSRERAKEAAAAAEREKELGAKLAAAAIWEGETRAHKSKSERLETELHAANELIRIQAERNGQLESQTNLRPLLEQAQNFERENQEVHLQIVSTVNLAVTTLGHVAQTLTQIKAASEERDLQILRAVERNTETTQGVQRATNTLTEIISKQLLVLLERLSLKVIEGGETGLRIEQHSAGVARDLAASYQRANDVQGGEAGAAADAAMRPEEKEKLDG